jgi:rare lipoprotein A (peptidoglycan hydrolase)
MAINVQKLLPSAKNSSALALSRGSSLSIKKKTADITKIATLSKERSDENVAIVRKSLIDVDTLIKSVVTEDAQTERTRRLRRENEDREERETKIEAPKEQKKFGLPKVSIPGSSFLDKIKRFLFFTALGWLFTRFNQELPRLEGILKTITSVYSVVETVFKFILESVVSFIERGYEAYDKVRETVKTVGGEKDQEDFDNLSSKLNEYINYVLVGGMALTGAINTFAKNARNYKPPKPQRPSGPSPAQRAAQKNALQRSQQAARIAARKASRAVIGKQATRQLLKLAKGPLSRLPIVGALVEFGLSWALGDNPGKAAFRGVGTLLLGAVGSLIMPGFGTFAGGWVGAELAGKLYDVLFENKKPEAKVEGRHKGGKIKRYATGGVVGSKGRTLTTQKSRKPSIPPQTLQPGKDVGGKNKIRKLYPDPKRKLTVSEWNLAGYAGTYADYEREYEKQKDRPSAYEALTDVRDTLSEIPFGIGSAMSAAIDAAFGQNISEGTINSIVSGLEGVYSIAYSASKNIESQTSNAVSGIAGQLPGMQSGGVIPNRTGGMMKTGDVNLTDFFRKDIKNKINSAIREVQKQLTVGKKKYTPQEQLDKGGKYLPPSQQERFPQGPTGKNGRYKPEELMKVGTLNEPSDGGPYWYGNGAYLRRGDAGPAFIKAKEAASKEKTRILINSAYRSYEHQDFMVKSGKYKVIAAPGQSAHGDGGALDIPVGSAGWKWMIKNGLDYGWKWMKYMEDEVHFEYVGGGKYEKQQTTPTQKTTPPKQTPTQTPKPSQKPTGKVYKGTASWYGRKDGFHGKTTSSGEIFNTDKLTAAIQWDLRNQFGGVSAKSQLYYAKVTNLDNGKSVTVKINDVGPLTSGGIIDLSEAAFKAIASGGLGQGRLYNVTVEKLGPAPREGSKQASISDEKKNQFAGLDMFDVGPFTSINGDLAINPSVLMGLESAVRNVAENYQTPNILSGTKSNDTQQYIPKQSTTKDVSSLTTYPTYSEEGGMIFAIQPIIVEKKVPISAGQNKATAFMITGSGGVNNTDISLNRG